MGQGDCILRLTGADAVTVLIFDRPGGRACRVWSSLPDVFAATGEKPLSGAAWEFAPGHLGPALVTRGAAAIRARFPDHARILGQGIGLLVNLPLIRADRCEGTVNCLYRDPAFDARFDAMIPQVARWVWSDMRPGLS